MNQLKLRENVTKVAVVITGGKTFTEKDKEDKDFLDTIRAANRLREANIYDQIYAIGVNGTNGAINDTQLKAIATDESYAFTLSSYTSDGFNELKRKFTEAVCTGKYYAKQKQSGAVKGCCQAK